MNMKKILASVAASAIAVTTLATVASAKVVDLATKGAPVHKATVTFTTPADEIKTVGDKAEIDLSTIADANSTITYISADVTMVCGKDKVTKTQTLDGIKAVNDAGKKISFATSDAEVLLDDSKTFTKVVNGAQWQATVTVKLESEKTEYKNEDSYKLTSAYTGKLVKEADGSRDSVIKLNEEIIISSDMDYVAMEAANVNGGTVAVTVKAKDTVGDSDAEIAEVIVKYAGKEIKKSDAVLRKGGSSTIKAEISNFATVDRTGKYDFKDLVVYIAVNPDKVEVASATFTYADPDDKPAETTTTTEKPNDVKPDETTTPAPTDPAATTTPAPKPTTPDDDKNAPTGVGLVVVPALVAAAGVIISKKRK